MQRTLKSIVTVLPAVALIAVSGFFGRRLEEARRPAAAVKLLRQRSEYYAQALGLGTSYRRRLAPTPRGCGRSW